MPGPRPGGIYGLRKHAGGAATNSHATGGLDPITAANIGAAAAPQIRLVNTSGSAAAGTNGSVASMTLDSGFTAFEVLHIYADIAGDATHNPTANIRITFTDATTKNFASGTTAAGGKIIAHYDHAASTATADAWATTETAVNLLIALGTANNAKKIQKVDLFVTSAPAGASYPWNFRVGGAEF